MTSINRKNEPPPLSGSYDQDSGHSQQHQSNSRAHSNHPMSMSDDDFYTNTNANTSGNDGNRQAGGGGLVDVLRMFAEEDDNHQSYTNNTNSNDNDDDGSGGGGGVYSRYNGSGYDYDEVGYIPEGYYDSVKSSEGRDIGDGGEEQSGRDLYPESKYNVKSSQQQHQKYDDDYSDDAEHEHEHVEFDNVVQSEGGDEDELPSIKSFLNLDHDDYDDDDLPPPPSQMQQQQQRRNQNHPPPTIPALRTNEDTSIIIPPNQTKQLTIDQKIELGEQQLENEIRRRASLGLSMNLKDKPSPSTEIKGSVFESGSEFEDEDGRATLKKSNASSGHTSNIFTPPPSSQSQSQSNKQPSSSKPTQKQRVSIFDTKFKPKPLSPSEDQEEVEEGFVITPKGQKVPIQKTFLRRGSRRNLGAGAGVASPPDSGSKGGDEKDGKGKDDKVKIVGKAQTSKPDVVFKDDSVSVSDEFASSPAKLKSRGYEDGEDDDEFENIEREVLNKLKPPNPSGHSTQMQTQTKPQTQNQGQNKAKGGNIPPLLRMSTDAISLPCEYDDDDDGDGGGDGVDGNNEESDGGGDDYDEYEYDQHKRNQNQKQQKQKQKQKQNDGYYGERDNRGYYDERAEEVGEDEDEEEEEHEDNEYKDNYNIGYADRYKQSSSASNSDKSNTNMRGSGSGIGSGRNEVDDYYNETSRNGYDAGNGHRQVGSGGSGGSGGNEEVMNVFLRAQQQQQQQQQMQMQGKKSDVKGHGQSNQSQQQQRHQQHQQQSQSQTQSQQQQNQNDTTATLPPHIQAELAHLRSEKQTTTKLKKQLHLSLSEITQKRVELSKILVDERDKMEEWKRVEEGKLKRERGRIANGVIQLRQGLGRGGVDGEGGGGGGGSNGGDEQANSSSQFMLLGPGSGMTKKERVMVQNLQETIARLKAELDSVKSKSSLDRRRLTTRVTELEGERDRFRQRVADLEEGESERVRDEGRRRELRRKVVESEYSKRLKDEENERKEKLKGEREVVRKGVEEEKVSEVGAQKRKEEERRARLDRKKEEIEREYIQSIKRVTNNSNSNSASASADSNEEVKEKEEVVVNVKSTSNYFDEPEDPSYASIQTNSNYNSTANSRDASEVVSSFPSSSSSKAKTWSVNDMGREASGMYGSGSGRGSGSGIRNSRTNVDSEGYGNNVRGSGSDSEEEEGEVNNNQDYNNNEDYHDDDDDSGTETWIQRETVNMESLTSRVLKEATLKNTMPTQLQPTQAQAQTQQTLKSGRSESSYIASTYSTAPETVILPPKSSRGGHLNPFTAIPSPSHTNKGISNSNSREEGKDTSPPPTHNSNKTADGRIERVLPNGSRKVFYKNGTIKEVDVKGKSVIRFLNFDVKTFYPSGYVDDDGDNDGGENGKGSRIVYYYAANQTTHTTYAHSGVEVFEFPNKQRETHFPDGRKEIVFGDGTRKIVHGDGRVECFFEDGDEGDGRGDGGGKGRY